MTVKPKINSDGRTITVRVPISIRKRGGRKLVLAPDGTMAVPTGPGLGVVPHLDRVERATVRVERLGAADAGPRVAGRGSGKE